MRKLLVFTDLAPQERVNVTNHLRQLGVGWAHYFASVWFLSDVQGRTVQWWFEQLTPVVGDRPLAVIEVDNRAWLARGPHALGNWLKTSWPVGPQFP
jgi:hypothetical protein